MARKRFHKLPKEHKAIIREIGAAEKPISPLSAARRFGGPVIRTLTEAGHLNEGYYQDKACVFVSPLTAREIEGKHPWTDSDDTELRERWARGERLVTVATEMKRQPGMVFSRVLSIRARRNPDGYRDFMPAIMAWRVRGLRMELIEAERRGLNLADDGSGLFAHRALLRRFHNARMLISIPGDDESPKWMIEDQRSLRGLRNAGKSVQRMANILDRDPEDVARRMIIEGRFVNGHWTTEEDEKISYGLRHGMPLSRIAVRLPNKSALDVRDRIHQLFGERRVRRSWTTAERRLLIDYHVAGYRGNEITKRIPSRGHHAIRRQLYGMLYEPREVKPWDEADLNILTRAMVRGESIADIAKWLGREIYSVRRLHDYKRGDQAGRRAKLTEGEALEVRRLVREENKSQSSVAERFKVSRATIFRTLRLLEDDKELRWPRKRYAPRNGKKRGGFEKQAST